MALENIKAGESYFCLMEHDKLMKVEKGLEALQHSLIGLVHSNKDYNDVVDDIYNRGEGKHTPST